MTALLYPGMIGAAPTPTPPPYGSFGPSDGSEYQLAPQPAPVQAPAAAPSVSSFGPTVPAAPATPAATPAPTAAPGGAQFGGTATAPAATPAPTPAPTGMLGVPSPAPAPTTGNWMQEVAGLNWSAGEGARSTANLWSIKNKYNLTDEQLAGGIKGSDGNPLWTGAQLAQHFQRFGYGATGPSPGVTGERAPDGRVTDSPMDFSNETIEGRLQNVLATDAAGNYTNQVVRQAVDRVNQVFNARGLRNSSMAAQAAQEAAISKAIEIVGPDAERYYQNRRANVDQGNQFAMKGVDTQAQKDLSAQQFEQNKALKEMDLGNSDADRTYKLRTDYLSANDRAMQRYTDTVNNINASQMTPADKTVAIQQATAARDADMTYVNNLFAAQPGWQKEWLAVAVPTADVDLNQITNIDMLANIANDPAQPFERRAAAKARMNTLLASAPAPAPAMDPAAGTGGMLSQPDWGPV